ncbi:hypothetical protein P7C70_g561, partial [Phenoliferia sp. Uapishka_3]
MSLTSRTRESTVGVSEGSGFGEVTFSKADSASEYYQSEWEFDERPACRPECRELMTSISPYPASPSNIPYHLRNSQRRPSLVSSPTADSMAVQSAVSPRKYSLPHAEAIPMAYPMLVSRTDASLPPTSFLSFAPKSAQPIPAKSRPPPIKIASSAHSTFLPPLLGRALGMKASNDDISAPLVPTVRAKPMGTPELAEVRSWRADVSLFHGDVNQIQPLTIKSPLQPQRVTFSQLPDSSTIPVARGRKLTPDSASKARNRESTITGVPLARVPPTSEEAVLSDEDDLPQTPHTPTRFRRAASCDESPKRPTETPAFYPSSASKSGAIPPRSGSISAVRTRSRTPSSRAGVAHHPPSSPPATPTARAFSTPSVHYSATAPADAFYTPSGPLPPQQTRSVTRATPPKDRNSVVVSVRDSKGLRDVAQAAYGSEGVSVFVKSSQRPEDMEVSWTSSPSYDAEGRLTTTWEVRIQPRSPPPHLETPLPVSPFAEYRLGVLPPSRLPGTAPTSPRSTSMENPVARTPPPIPDADFLDGPYSRQRKTSTARSDYSSFSSESSGPLTPRRGTLRTEAEEISIARKGSLGALEGVRSPSKHRFGCYIPPVEGLEEAILLVKRKTSRTKLQNRSTIATAPLPSLSDSDDPQTSTTPELTHVIPFPLVNRGHAVSKSDSALAAMSPDPSDFSDQDDNNLDETGIASPSRRDVEKALARQETRALSRWSDTDGETDDDDPAPTSWSDVPDAESIISV